MQRYKKSAKSKTEQVKNLRHLRNLRDLKNNQREKKKDLHENKKASEIFRNLRLCKRRRLPTLPHCIAVPSAQVSLTSLFGMGRGGTSPQ